MKANHYDAKMKSIFDAYKMNLAVLIKKGKNVEVISMLKDIQAAGKPSKRFSETLKNVSNCSTAEEIFIRRVNFVLSLMTHEQRVFLMNEYFYENGTSWYLNDYSRSTYYRNKADFSERFLTFFEGALDEKK